MITRAKEGPYCLRWDMRERRLYIYDDASGFLLESIRTWTSDANADFRWCVKEFREWAARRRAVNVQIAAATDEIFRTSLKFKASR